MTDLARADERSGFRWTTLLLQLAVAYILALRLWFDVAVTPMGDEAYYWMWGQHLSWSYFDHPPLHAWLLAGVAAIFGWSNFSVRLLTSVSLAGTLVIFWLWSKRLSPQARSDWFWQTSAIYLTIPVIAIISTFAFHDHLLLFFAAAATYVFWTFADGFENARPDWRRLYGAAALLGLAALTKYNAVLLGLGFGIWIVVRPPLRPLLARVHLWLAVLLVVALQAPVIGWNIAEGLASFRFHLTERPSVNWSDPRLGQVIMFVANMVVFLSPVLFLTLFRLFWLRPASVNDQRTKSLSSTLFLVSTLAWAGVAAYVYVFFHWNILAYAALAPIAARLLGGRILLWLHVSYGLVVVTAALLSYTVTPISVFGFSDLGAPASYGWSSVADEVRASLALHPGAFPAATRYTYAAQLGFMLHNPDVAAFNPLPSENDFWWNRSAHLGQDAVIVADRAFPISNARPAFASVRHLATVPVERFGKTIWSFDIWLGQSYSGGESVPAVPKTP